MVPLLFECDSSTGEPVQRLTYPREETNPSSLMFWAAAFILVDVFWAVSALFLDGRIAGICQKYLLEEECAQ